MASVSEHQHNNIEPPKASSMNTFAVAVIQSTAVVQGRQGEPQSFPVLNVIVETESHFVSLVRYIPDLVEFDQLIKTHYHKVKIPFPSLAMDKAEKRRSLRHFLTSLSHTRHKTVAERIERYLQRCADDPLVRNSSIFRDFIAPQREEDAAVLKNPPPSDDEAVVPPASPDQSTDQPRPEASRDAYPIANTYAPMQPVHTTDLHEAESVPHSPSLQPSVHYLEVSSTEEPSQDTVPETTMSVDDKAGDGKAMHDNDTTATATSAEAVAAAAVAVTDRADHGHEPRVSAYSLESLEMIKVLGKGCMGKVFLVRSCVTNEHYALKSIMKELVVEQREIVHTLAERDILATLSSINHPFLAKLHASFQDEHRLYLVTNYYCGGDLATQMSTCTTFSKERTLFYAAEIIEGIGELHRLGVLYRDLKPENILLTLDGHIVLTDFGLSKWLEGTDSEQAHTHTFCGTAEYLAPEALLGEPYSYGIDHWAYGTILYEMLAGITPFWANNHADMYRRVLQDPLEFPPDTDFETAEFLSALLDRNPHTRLGANGVDEIKSHIYFADISWDDVYHRRLEPPYVPPLTSMLDLSNFDPSFLEMAPTLTPVPSETHLAEDVQQVFDGYSFTTETGEQDQEEVLDESLITDPVCQSDPVQPTAPTDRTDHLDRTTPAPASAEEKETDQRRTLDRTEEQLMNEKELYHPSFQPLKRTSMSLLSDIDSFHLETSSTTAPTVVHDGQRTRDTPAGTDDAHQQEKTRYAKRRNTSTEQDAAYQQQLSELRVVSEPLVSVSDQHVPNLSVASTADDLLDELVEFGDLDLRLSFTLPVQKTQSQSSTSSHHRRKARRFFTPLLRF